MLLLEEVHDILQWEDRHRRLVARLILVVLLSLVVDVVGSVLIWLTERGHADIHGFGDAVFFTTVQLLTVSSQIKNPVTVAGRVIDVGLELWAVVVVAGSAGAIAAFFQSANS